MSLSAYFSTNNRWDLIESDEEDYNEEEFSKFLVKMKDNLSKLKSKRTCSIKEVDNENDTAFMKFLEKLKNDCTEKSEKSQSSPVIVNCASPYKNVTSSSFSENSQHVSIKNESFISSEVLSMFQEEDLTKNFYTKRESCAQKLYKFFNKKIFDNKLPHDMELDWSVDLRTTAGKTSALKKGNTYYDCKIILASKVLTTFERLRDTLLHEMCHAAVFLISQVSGVNHGPLWKNWAARCNLILPDVEVPTRCHNYDLSFPFTYQCNKCSWKCGRYKSSTKLSKARCPKCMNSLSLNIL